jgi:uncharacterized caspase-like protein
MWKPICPGSPMGPDILARESGRVLDGPAEPGSFAKLLLGKEHQAQALPRLPQALVMISMLIATSLSFLVPCAAQNRKRQVALQEEHAPASKKSGGYYALVIGINNYQHLNKLKTPLNDAKELARILHDEYRFETKMLLDATRRQVLDSLDDYREKLQENDSLLIYYAGHGYYDEAADLAYWAPSDAESNSHDDWIVANEITGTVRAIRARHVLIVSDSCYSGMLTRDARPGPDTEALADHSAYLARMLRGKSRNVMSSGGKEPVADGDAGSHTNHSVFADALLQGLLQFNLDTFSADELFSQYVRVRVSSQMPEYNIIRDSGYEDGDFVFFRAELKPAHPATGTKNAVGKTRSAGQATDADAILRSFKTMYVLAQKTRFFSSNDLKAALAENKDFVSLHIQIVDDREAADVVLDVTYTPAWDYPFALKHQSTSLVLLAGKGTGPFSGPVGATSVAKELVKLAKPYRAESETKNRTESEKGKERK